MRTIRNLAWFLLAFMLTLWTGFAYAQTPQQGFQYTLSGVIYRFHSATDVCSFVVSKQPGSVFGRAALSSNPSSFAVTCYGTRPPSTTEQVLVSGNMRVVCTAAAPYWDLQKGCVNVKPSEPDPDPPQNCPDNLVGEASWFAGKTGGAYPEKSVIQTGGCVSGCKVEVQEVQRCWSSGGNDYCRWSYTGGGAKCTVGSAPEPADVSQGPADPRIDVPPLEASPCPKGTVNGGISDTGLQRCIGTGSDPKNKPPVPPKVETEKTETADDGTKTTTKTEVTTNSDGSKTTTTTVTITKPDGTKQVDQQKDTSKTPTNAPGKDDSAKDDEKYDLCKQNPLLNICKNSTIAGKCGEISCTGDAIQCATLRAAAAMQCKQQTDEEALKASPLTAIGDAAIKGTGLDSLPNPGNGQIVKLPSLETQGWLGNGAAFEDVTVKIQGQDVLVPLSKWSQYLLPFRFIMMIIASLISYKILAGAVLRE